MPGAWQLLSCSIVFRFVQKVIVKQRRTTCALLKMHLSTLFVSVKWNRTAENGGDTARREKSRPIRRQAH